MRILFTYQGMKIKIKFDKKRQCWTGRKLNKIASPDIDMTLSDQAIERRTSFRRGHKVLFIDNKWVYADTLNYIDKEYERPCKKCGKRYPVDGGYDLCLGYLPGVTNACCGHGAEESAYVVLKGGLCLVGSEALDLMHKIRDWGKG